MSLSPGFTSVTLSSPFFLPLTVACLSTVYDAQVSPILHADARLGKGESYGPPYATTVKLLVGPGVVRGGKRDLGELGTPSLSWRLTIAQLGIVGLFGAQHHSLSETEGRADLATQGTHHSRIVCALAGARAKH